jgi:hypothetical protein
VLWRAADKDFTIDMLAHLAAPVLWFSPDEPLYRAGAIPPEAISGDGALPIVYYNIRYIELTSAASAALYDQLRSAGPELRELPWSFTPHGAVLNATLIKRVIIRYFFHYQEDYGFGGHIDDLESADGDSRRGPVTAEHRSFTGFGVALKASREPAATRAAPKRTRFTASDALWLIPCVIVDSPVKITARQIRTTEYLEDPWCILVCSIGRELRIPQPPRSHLINRRSRIRAQASWTMPR